MLSARPCVGYVAIGARFFPRSKRLYRLVAYAIIVLAAMLSLPVLDPLLR